jgi:serine/threonine-protein kinase HipA
MAECILVSLSNMEEVSTMDGLRGSIEAHLNNVMKTSGIQPVFRHDKKKKYE